MALDMITRRELGWPARKANTNTNLGMIAHYDSSKGLLAGWRKSGHTACTAYWKRVRSMHMNGNGWSDVGYAYFVCPCRKVFEGRGVDRIQAAELPTRGKLQNGNSRYVAVTFGTGVGEIPEPGQVQAWHDLRDWLMREHGVAAKVYGHRDFTSTSCPGTVIYDLVRSGALSKRPGTPPVPPPDGKDDVVAQMPMLREGVKSFDVLTLRAVLFERYLSERFDPGVTPEDESHTTLFGWLREDEFDPALKADVQEYQSFRGLDPDGIVGPLTWSHLLRFVK